jgi:hypothetical protein
VAGVFVRSHQPEEGDLLILYRNVECNKIVLYLDVLNTITGGGWSSRSSRRSAAAARRSREEEEERREGESMAVQS